MPQNAETKITIDRLCGLGAEFGVGDFFGCFDEGRLAQFAEVCRFIEVSAGFKPSFRDVSTVPPHDVVCLILEGSFVVQEAIGGEMVTLAIRSKGDFLNEMEAVSGVGLSRSISPLTDGLLISIPSPLFRETIEANPLAKFLGEMFVNKLRTDNLRAEVISRNSHTMAIATLIYRLSTPPFALLHYDPPTSMIVDMWTYDMLESYIGCERNTLKDAIEKLEKMKAIEFMPEKKAGDRRLRFKFKIKDMETLRSYVSGL